MTTVVYTICPECGAHVGPGTSHGILCSQMKLEEKAMQTEQYYRAWLESQAKAKIQRDRFAEQVTLWQGKFKAVKEENNALRKQIRKLRA